LRQEENWKGLRVARPVFKIVPGLSGAFNPISLYYAAKPVLQKWWDEGFRFDIIDTQFFYPDGPATCRLASRFKVPFSIKARGADIHYWGSRLACRRQILTAAAQADGLLAVAQSLRHDMVVMGIEKAKINVHYTGIDLERFRPISFEEREQTKAALGVSGPLVVSVGALIRRKGHDILIEAMSNLEGVTLLVAGEGPERSRLEAMVRNRGLTDRVRLLGNLPHDRLPSILGAADMMALASKSEGLANAWVEALACGTPIIIPDVDGAQEVLDRPEAGRLVQASTPEAFVEAIRAMLIDRPLPEAVRRSAERFTWERNASGLYQHLKKLQEKKSSASSST
jgi:glycosyltransferase involved in cell wall biosynthesis